MRISSSPPPSQACRKLPGSDLQPASPPPTPPPDDESEVGENVARWLARGSQAIANIPQLVEKTPWLKQNQYLREAGTAIQATAGVAGAISAFALSTAGALEIDDGVRHNNHAETLKGVSEIARAGYVGGWTTGQLIQGSFWQGSLLNSAAALSFVSGALQTAGGIARMRHEGRDDNPVRPKVVGLLEAGMGLTWVGATLGLPVALCFVARMGLSATRAIYTNQQTWQDWTKTDARGKV